MTLLTEAGSFVLNTGTGNQTVPLVDGSLTPKAVLLWTTAQTADGITTDAKIFLGFATSTTTRATIGTTSQDGQASSVADRTNDNDELLQCRPVNGGAVSEEVDLVSFSAGQFVVNISVAGAAIKIGYKVWGGADLTDAIVVEFLSGSGTGNLDVTTVGFEPDFVMIFGEFDVSPDRAVAGAFGGFGWAAGAGGVSVGWAASDASATMVTERCQRSDSVVAIPNSAVGFAFRFTLDSFLVNGFRLNRVVNAFANRLFWALCLKGGQYQVGVETQKISTSGTKSTTTTFEPKGLLLASFNRTATTSVSADGARVSLGAASSLTARAATWIGDTDNVSDSECDRAMKSDQCLLLADAGSPTGYAAAADLNSFNATDFTLDWDNGTGGNPDAIAREFIWAVFGDNPAVDAISNTDFRNKQIIQRAIGAHDAVVPFSGTYTNTTPASIEVEIREDGTTNVIQSWTSLSSPTIGSGAWSGTLSVPESDLWYNFISRSKNGVGTVLATSNQTAGKWSVGVLVSKLGQSNMKNEFIISSSPPTPDVGTSRHHSGTTWGDVTGNGAIRFANTLRSLLGCSVGLLDYAVSGSGLTVGTDNWLSSTTGQPYPLFQIGLADAGGDCEYVDWHQGEGDALNAPGITIQDYKDGMDEFYGNLQTDTGRDNTELFFGCAMIATMGNVAIADDDTQAVRVAQLQWSIETIGAFFAGSSIDMVRFDDYHYTAASYERKARRSAQAIARHAGVVAYGADGPVITSAVRTLGSPIVRIVITHDGGTSLKKFDGSTDGVALTGFEFSDDDFSMLLTIESTAFVGNEIHITLDSTPADEDVVKLRNLFGTNPDITNIVFDNTTPGGDTVGLPLQPTQAPITVSTVEPTTQNNAAFWLMMIG